MSACPDLLPGLPDPLPTPVRETEAPVWARRPDVRRTHRAALKALLAASVPPCPSAEGDGIVMCGGGPYWPMIVIALRMIREVTDLPIQIWHRGDEEPVRPEHIGDVAGVTFHDATRYPTRVLGGWQIKTIALVHCGLERVLFLDADAYLVAGPQKLLDAATEATPFVYWQDLPHTHDLVNWAAFGRPWLVSNRVPSIQGGQLALHRPAFWRTLVVAHWLNQHSDYSYEYGYGDQDQWRVALAATGSPYRCLGRADWDFPAFVCRVDGEPLVVHRCRSKWWGRADDVRVPRLPGEARAWGHRTAYVVGCAPGDPGA